MVLKVKKQAKSYSNCWIIRPVNNHRSSPFGQPFMLADLFINRVFPNLVPYCFCHVLFRLGHHKHAAPHSQFVGTDVLNMPLYLSRPGGENEKDVSAQNPGKVPAWF